MARIALLGGYYTHQNEGFSQSNLDITDRDDVVCGKEVVSYRKRGGTQSPGPAAFLTLSSEAKTSLSKSQAL